MDSVRIFDGQEYVPIGVEPHIRRDGRQTYLMHWETNCAECGASFTLKTLAGKSRFEPTRRCSLHRQPGLKVRRAE